MNTRATTIVLTIASLIVGYFILFETELLFSPDENPNTTGQPLFPSSLTSQSIQALTLTLPNHPPVTFQRDPDNPDRWQQTDPFAFPANPQSIDELLKLITTLNRYDTVEQTNLDPFGLTSPQTVITLQADDAVAATLALGRSTAAGRAYLQHNDTAYLVDDSIHQQLHATAPSDFRLDTLPPLAPGNVTSITLTSPRRTVTLNRQDAAWAFAPPDTGRVDRAAAARLIEAYNQLVIQRFVSDSPDDLAACGLEPEPTTIQFNTPTTSHTLTLGNPADVSGGSYYARSNDTPAIFIIPARNADVLASKIDDVRDLRLVTTRRDQLREIRITPSNAPELHFVLAEGVWRYADPAATHNADQDAVKQLLDDLYAPADQGAAPVPGRDSPLGNVTIQLTAAGQTEPETLKLMYGLDTIYAVRNNEPIAYRLSDKCFRDLTPLHFQNRTVIAINPADITAIESRHIRPDNATRPTPYPWQLRLAKRDNQWDFAGFDTQRIQNLTTHLNPLRADQWIATPLTFNPHCTLRIPRKDQASIDISIDTEYMTGQYQGQYFKLSRETLEALTTDLRDRDVLAIDDISDLHTITLGDHTYTRADDGSYTVYTPHGNAPFDPQRVAAMFTALAACRADAYAHPEHFKLGTPHTLTFTLAAAPDTPRTLKIWPPSQNGSTRYLAQHNNTTFILTTRDAEKLLWAATDPALMNK